MKTEYDLQHFKDCKSDAGRMIAGGIITLAAMIGLKWHVDSLGLTEGWKVGLMCMLAVTGATSLAIGLALGISLLGQTAAQRMEESHGCPGPAKRRVYSLLCGMNAIALVAATATLSARYGTAWQSALVIAVCLVGLAFTDGLARELREIAEDEQEQKEEENKLAEEYCELN